MASKRKGLPFDPILRDRELPPKDGTSPARENCQRLASPTALMKNDEGNGEGEGRTGDGIYRLFILKSPDVLLFAPVLWVSLAVHT